MYKRKNKTPLKNEYQIIEKIGSGSFGEVYYAKCIKTNKYVAAKIEFTQKHTPKIINEYNIYQHLIHNGFIKGIPAIYDIFQTPRSNIMIMQLLGQNLEELFVKNKRKFSVSTVLYIGIQIISLLEQLHNVHFVHRDIKPNNFLIGLNRNSNRIYIMDFGLSKKYIAKNNRHIDFRNDRSLIGTARYASINIHMGIEPSRRDDLESVGYMLIYFLKGILPWQGSKKQNGKTHIETIGEIKMTTSIDKLCENVPECFREYLIYCRDLAFDKKPDYVYMKNLFVNYHKQNNIKLEFDWIINDQFNNVQK
jgi:serine/threonine protein kinase